MPTNNFDLVNQLLALPWYNLILISLLVIPLFIGAWITLLSSLNIPFNDQQKKRAVLLFLFIYVIGLTVGKIGQQREQMAHLDRLATNIQEDLKQSGGILGFKRLREKHPSYTEELLYQVAESYPQKFEVTAIADPAEPTRRDPTDPFGLKIRN